jgi:GGDEF domain-containing protein
MSIGIATRWPGRGEAIEITIHRADQAMYHVKRTGRGHWRVAQPREA